MENHEPVDWGDRGVIILCEPLLYGGLGTVKPDPGRTCQACGAMIPADSVVCPVCALRGALDKGHETVELSVDPTPPLPALRFDHYQVLTREDGTPLELGHGAMGVTYKAIDINLRCAVALKVINARFIGDESARRRFIREARAAASVRHPHVASVFHLGQTGDGYFYAMEFVEGETLESLIKRSGRLEVGLALEITSQVAAGLDSVHEQKLVHRDIKPTNIMVRLKDEGSVTAKIIDLGLAKGAIELVTESGISTPGVFAGTPAFASPEQFAGLGVDIRSDLYSLGVTLWAMLAGQLPFRGSSAEMMQQHQHSPLPLEQLKGLPQPLVVLLEVLLAKDPVRRFQTPAELLKLIPTVRDATKAGRAMMKTIRVFFSSASDVQKERHVAERVMRSIAGEFNLPVSDSCSIFQRLAEENGGPETEPDNQSPLVLCPYVLDQQRMELDEGCQGTIPNIAEFDLVICILWSRLGAVLAPTLRMPDGSTPGTATEYEIGWALNRGDRNMGVPHLRVYRNRSKPVPPLEPKEEREAFGRQWDSVQEFFARSETNGEGKLAGIFNNYTNLQEFEELFRGHFRDFLLGLVDEETGQKALSRKVRRWKSSPFRGLNFFDFEHAPIFYGRTRAIGGVLEALEGQVRAQRPFVLVLGASGSGKSSLVRAGVLPLLTHPGTIEGVGLWRWSLTRPGAGGSGSDCFDALAAALLECHALPDLADPESQNPIRDLGNELREHSDTVALRVRDALDHAAREWKIQRCHSLEEKEHRLSGSGSSKDADIARQQRESVEVPKARLGLVVDQFEELFTTGFSLKLRQKYISGLAGLVKSGRVFVLATLRNDFYASYQEFPDLIELTKPSGKFDLRPPTPSEIGNMIRLPAEAAGLHFERDMETGQCLDDALRDAASATPESLPLLEHVLSLLYDLQSTRGDGLLRWSDYRELGELKGALAKHAEAVFSTLGSNDQSAFPLVMRHLVTLGQGEEEVPNRRTVHYRDFVASGKTEDQKAGAKGLVDLFIEKRLFVADSDPQGEVTVSVAHEALLREWQRLREWLKENREFLRMRDRLDLSLKLWLSRGRHTDDLLEPGLHLAEGEKLVRDFGPSLSGEEIDYVYASIAERNRRKRAQARIRYAVMVAISVLAIAAGLQWFRAEGQRQSANAARQSAEEILNYLLNQLSAKLEPIGHLDIVDDVQKQVESYYKNLGFSDRDPKAANNWATLLQREGDRLVAQGDLNGARAKYQEELEVTQKLVKQAPNEAAWQRSLSVAYECLGDVLKAQGDLTAAKAQYQRELEIRRQLAEQDPADSGRQRDLSVCYKRLGDVLKALGDLSGARLQYERGLEIAQTVVKKEPSNTIWRNDLFIFYVVLGDVSSVQGELNRAKTEYQNSLDVIQRTVKLEPGDTRWQRNLGANYNRLGDALKALGDLNGAKVQYEKGLEITDRLVKQDPSNSGWQLDLVVSYDVLSSLLLAQGNLSEAKVQCQNGLAITEKLAKQDPGNTDWQYNLWDIHEGLGDICRAQRDFDNAFTEYQAAFGTIQKLAVQDPSNGDWQHALAVADEKLGDVLHDRKDLVGARAEYQNALAILQGLAKKDPSNTVYQYDLSGVYRGLGEVQKAQGDATAAEQNFRASLGILAQLLQTHGENATWKADFDSVTKLLADQQP